MRNTTSDTPIASNATVHAHHSASGSAAAATAIVTRRPRGSRAVAPSPRPSGVEADTVSPAKRVAARLTAPYASAEIAVAARPMPQSRAGSARPSEPIR